MAIKLRVKWTTPGEHTLSATCGQSSDEKKIKVYKVQIFANDQDVTGGSFSTVVGKRVKLECRVTPEVEFTNEWDLPSAFVRDYKITYNPTNTQHPHNSSYNVVDTVAVVHLFFDSDFQTAAISPCWIRKVVNGRLTAEVTIADRTHNSSASITVEAPDVVITANSTTDNPKITLTNVEVTLGKNSKGITIAASCETAAGQAGTFQFLQKTRFDRSTTTQQSFSGVTRLTTTRTHSGGLFVLDRKPETPNAWNFQDKSLHLNDNDCGNLTITDSPGLLISGITLDLSALNEQFTTHLMYQPDGADSIWVSLEVVHWGWHARVAKNPSGVYFFAEPERVDSPRISAPIALPLWNGRALDAVVEKNTTIIPD